MRTLLTHKWAERSISQFKLACDRQGKITRPMAVIAECDKETFKVAETIKQIRRRKIFYKK
jgi:hypothetical protein